MTCMRLGKIDMGQNTFKEAKKGIKCKKLPCTKQTWFIYVLQISNHGNHRSCSNTYKCQETKIKNSFSPTIGFGFS